MTIIVNNNQVDLPSDVESIKDFVNWKKIPNQATAIALNGKLIKVENWGLTRFSNLDNLLVISAAFGG